MSAPAAQAAHLGGWESASASQYASPNNSGSGSADGSGSASGSATLASPGQLAFHGALFITGRISGSAPLSLPAAASAFAPGHAQPHQHILLAAGTYAAGVPSWHTSLPRQGWMQELKVLVLLPVRMQLCAWWASRVPLQLLRHHHRRRAVVRQRACWARWLVRPQRLQPAAALAAIHASVHGGAAADAIFAAFIPMRQQPRAPMPAAAASGNALLALAAAATCLLCLQLCTRQIA